MNVKPFASLINPDSMISISPHPALYTGRSQVRSSSPVKLKRIEEYGDAKQAADILTSFIKQKASGGIADETARSLWNNLKLIENPSLQSRCFKYRGTDIFIILEETFLINYYEGYGVYLLGMHTVMLKTPEGEFRITRQGLPGNYSFTVEKVKLLVGSQVPVAKKPASSPVQDSVLGEVKKAEEAISDVISGPAGLRNRYPKIEEIEKAINVLGEVFSARTINDLIDISEGRALPFSILKQGNKVLFRAAPRKYELVGWEYAGYEHDGRDFYRPILCLSGELNIPPLSPAAFTGIISKRTESEQISDYFGQARLEYGFVRLDPPMTEEQIKDYCQGKGIAESGFEDSLLSDCNAILEKFAEITNQNKPFILHDNLRRMYGRREIEIPEQSTIGELIQLIRRPLAQISRQPLYRTAMAAEMQGIGPSNILVPLGFPDEKARSDKGKGFLVFAKLGLRYPQGFVILAEAVEKVLSGDEKIIDEIVDRLMLIFDVDDKHETFQKRKIAISEEDIRSRQKEITSLEHWLEKLKQEISIIKGKLNKPCDIPMSHNGNPPEHDYLELVLYGDRLVKDELNRKLKEKQEEYAFLQLRIEELKDAGAHYALSFAVRSASIVLLPGVLATKLDIDRRQKLRDAIKAVALSWNEPRAVAMRRNLGISDAAGMEIIVQIMVHGDKDDNSGAGVVFSRNPDIGEKGLFGNFKVKASGSEIVSGSASGETIQNLKDKFPEVFEILSDALPKIEKESGYPQEIEFIVQHGDVYFLQKRAIKFTPQAELRYIQSAVGEGLITELQALPKLEAVQERVARRRVFKFKEGIERKIIRKGIAAIPGAMFGRLVFSVAAARKFSKEGEGIIFFSTLQTRNDILENIFDFPRVGLITLYGNASSHEAVLTRMAGIPAIINIVSDRFPWSLCVDVPKGNFWFEGKTVKEGDYIAIDGSGNEIFLSDDKEILVEDTFAFDASFGIRVADYRENFLRPYLGQNGQIKEDVEYEQLLKANVEAWLRYKRMSGENDKKAILIANLEKHFLHALFLQKAREIGKSVEDTQKELRVALRECHVMGKTQDESSAEGVGSVSKAEIENLLQEKLEVRDPHLLEDGYGSFWLYVDGGLSELEETHEHMLGVLRRIEAVMSNLNYNQLILLRDKLDYLSKVGDIIMDIPGGHRLAGEPNLEETLVSYSDVREIAEILILKLELFLRNSTRSSSPVEIITGDTLTIDAESGLRLISWVVLLGPPLGPLGACVNTRGTMGRVFFNSPMDDRKRRLGLMFEPMINIR